jgi:protein-S-isoprenylcysteine O-methyltransferase Ste14
VSAAPTVRRVFREATMSLWSPTLFDDPSGASARDGRKSFRIAPTAVIDTAISLAYVVILVPHWARIRLDGRPFWPQVLFAILILAAYAAKPLVIRHLDKSGGDARTYVKSADLVTTGPYAISRNPTYLLSMIQFLMWSALALYLQAYEPFQLKLVAVAILAPLIFFAINDIVVMPAEEKMLRKLHPEAFDAYARRVRRWIGWRAATA